MKGTFALLWFLTLVGLIPVLGLFVQANPIYACSCIPPGSPSEALRESELVFAGEVQSVEESRNLLGMSSGLDPTTVTFNVQTIWKGPPQGTLDLTTAREGASCGFTFSAGQRYVVYSRDGATVNLCSRTAPYSQAGRDLDELGEGNIPDDGPVSPNSSGGRCGLSPVPGAGGIEVSILGLGLGVTWLGLRRFLP